MNYLISRVARIVDVTPIVEGAYHVGVLIGGLYREIEFEGPQPYPGEVYLVAPGNPPELIEKIGGARPDGWSVDCDGMRWRKSNSRGQTRFDALWQRHKIRRAVREYFDLEGFIQIDTPLLVRGTTPDATIQSFAFEGRYLITSSEYQMKRLEVGGFDRLYSLTQNFRRSDAEGRFRNQEFTMLEWARVGEDLDVVEDDVEALILAAHQAIGGAGYLIFDDHTVDLTPPWDRLAVSEAIGRHIGAPLPDFSLASLREAVAKAGISIQQNLQDDIYFLFSLLMDHIQPSLGCNKPIFLRDWPAFETSSAAERSAGMVERSELFVAGVELSDGFPSLTDFDRQRQNFEEQNRRRRADGICEAELDESYLDALRAGLPPGAGMALGFDRLVMVLTDRSEIRDVLAFHWDEL